MTLGGDDALRKAMPAIAALLIGVGFGIWMGSSKDEAPEADLEPPPSASRPAAAQIPEVDGGRSKRQRSRADTDGRELTRQEYQEQTE